MAWVRSLVGQGTKIPQDIQHRQENTLKKKKSTKRGFPGASVSKESASNAGDLSSIPGSGRSPGEGNGNLLQYSCLGNPMDRGPRRATGHGVARVGQDIAMKPLIYFPKTEVTIKYFFKKTTNNKC